MSRAVAGVLLACLAAAAVALPLAPCAAGEQTPRFAARLAVYGIGALVCHQKPERSFRSCGRPWPVCGRCAGLYLGAAAGALLGLTGLGSRTSGRSWRRWLVAAAMPTAALWLLEIVGLWDPGTPLRAGVAALAGAAGGGWLAAVARGDLR